MHIPPGINLTAAENDLITRAQRAVAAVPLDSAALHALVPPLRKAKEKYTQLHRRQAAARVTDDRARGVAAGSGLRTEGKAEVFASALDEVEDALARANDQTD